MEIGEGHEPRVRHDLDLGPVVTHSSSSLVADSLRRLITLGALTPGERLPSERQLAETLRVGRDSIRAAIRLLGSEGLVETRRGRHGGSFVTDTPVLQQRLSTEILASHREIRASYEFRRALEPEAARLAAQRADDDAIRALLAIADEQAWSYRSWRAVDTRFHIAVAEASANELFKDAIHRTRVAFFGWYDTIYARIPWDDLPIEDRDFGYVHRPIAEAIARRDGDLAANLMRAALEWSERDLEDVLDKFVAVTAAGRGSGGGRHGDGPRGQEPADAPG